MLATFLADQRITQQLRVILCRYLFTVLYSGQFCFFLYYLFSLRHSLLSIPAVVEGLFPSVTESLSS